MQASYGRKPSGTFAAGKPQASAEAAQAAEEAEMKKATLQAYERALEELKIKTETQRGFVGANTQKLAEWKEKVADYQGGMDCALPVFPVGDALLEPFWPQGLGSNRGFHSALDAVWAVR